MWLNKLWLAFLSSNEASQDEPRQRMVELLGRRYVRQKQHVMRLRQHAARIADAAIGATLAHMAAEAEPHVGSLADSIVKLGGTLPQVIDFHCSHESLWDYLRSDLDEERRCVAEIEDDKENLQSDFPEIVALLDRIEADALRHRQEIRALFLRREISLPWAA